MRKLSSGTLLIVHIAFCGIVQVQGANVEPEYELPMDFLEACTQGQVDLVRKDLEQFPDWAIHGRSPQGETCLHLAGIMGQTEITRMILKEYGGNPNIRTTFEKGQRMHPLSWNVFGGHVETARVLLEHGADVNLDVDWPVKGSEAKATPLDILSHILPDDFETKPDMKKYADMKKLLLEYGAKTYSELETDSEL